VDLAETPEGGLSRRPVAVRPYQPIRGLSGQLRRASLGFRRNS